MVPEAQLTALRDRPRPGRGGLVRRQRARGGLARN